MEFLSILLMLLMLPIILIIGYEHYFFGFIELFNEEPEKYTITFISIITIFICFILYLKHAKSNVAENEKNARRKVNLLSHFLGIVYCFLMQFICFYFFFINNNQYSYFKFSSDNLKFTYYIVVLLITLMYFIIEYIIENYSNLKNLFYANMSLWLLCTAPIFWCEMYLKCFEHPNEIVYFHVFYAMIIVIAWFIMIWLKFRYPEDKIAKNLYSIFLIFTLAVIPIFVGITWSCTSLCVGCNEGCGRIG